MRQNRGRGRQRTAAAGQALFSHLQLMAVRDSGWYENFLTWWYQEYKMQISILVFHTTHLSAAQTGLLGLGATPGWCAQNSQCSIKVNLWALWWCKNWAELLLLHWRRVKDGRTVLWGTEKGYIFEVWVATSQVSLLVPIQGAGQGHEAHFSCCAALHWFIFDLLLKGNCRAVAQTRLSQVSQGGDEPASETVG